MSSRTKFFNSHPQDGALAEIPDGKPCWALTAKIAKGTADGVLVLDMTHACDVLRVYGDQLSPTLQARMGTGGNQVPLVYPLDVRNAVRPTRDMTQGVGIGKPGGPMYTLTSAPMAIGVGIETSFPQWQEEKSAPVTVGHQQGVAIDNASYAIHSRIIKEDGKEAKMNGFGVSKEKDYTETARDRHGVIQQQAQEVRRLTPRECERLQGFPDDWTLITFHNRPAADGPRYRAIGNSWAVPVIRWIGRRMDKWLKERE